MMDMNAKNQYLSVLRKQYLKTKTRKEKTSGWWEGEAIMGNLPNRQEFLLTIRLPS
ncbi:MAG: hypothetical protein ACPLXP_03190 [Microgenomates group bacterium]